MSLLSELSSKAFSAIVLAILKRPGQADRLELEVTETSAFPSNAPMSTLNSPALGVTIAIDADFGTGYSSFMAESAAFDKIKIDKSFVTSISTHEDALNIIKLITSMAKSLSMKVVAERNRRAAPRLRRWAATQGYSFSKPQLFIDENIKNGPRHSRCRGQT